MKEFCSANCHNCNFPVCDFPLYIPAEHDIFFYCPRTHACQELEWCKKNCSQYNRYFAAKKANRMLKKETVGNNGIF